MEQNYVGTARISRMLAQLIQALYNIVDSFFVGRYSDVGLTALTIVYPLQLLMVALAVGTGVGINTAMAYFLGVGDQKRSDEAAGISTPLELAIWAIFALISYFAMPYYARMSTQSEAIIQEVVTYGRIVCVFSFAVYLESGWTKVLQAEGNMNRPLLAQVAGAVTNIVLESPADLRYVGSAADGRHRRGRGHRGGPACRRRSGVLGRVPALPGPVHLLGDGGSGLPAGHTQHPDAGCLYLLYLGIEPDPKHLFRPGRHRAGPLL